MQGVNGLDQVANILRIHGYFQSQRIFDASDRGQRMNCCADSTDTLGKKPGISWVASLENNFDATPHLAR